MTDHVLEVVMGPNAEPLPTAVRAEGVYVFDAEGRRYLDATCGCFVSTIGHGVPEVTAAIKAQLDKLTYVHWSQMLNEPAQELAELITELTPGHSHCHFVTSGSEAVEAAIYAAHLFHRNRGERERHKVLTRDGSYHGATIGAMSATGVPGLRWPAYEHPSFRHVAANTCSTCPFGSTYPECNLLCASDLERAILSEGPRTVSAFMVDPSASSGWPPDAYWPGIRQICDKYGVLLIADEVKSGFGKTGTPFALQHWGVTPDVNVFGKAVAGGFAPLAGISVREELARSYAEISKGFPSGHTFMNNPLTCAAALATQRYVLEHRLMERVPRIEKAMRDAFEPFLARFSVAAAYQSMGLLSSLWIRTGAMGADDSPLERNRRLRRALLNHGVCAWVYSGPGFSRIQLSPPFVFEQAHIEQLADAVRKMLEDLA